MKCLQQSSIFLTLVCWAVVSLASGKAEAAAAADPADRVAVKLQQIRAIGNDMALDPGIGNCGKAGQWVPVGVG